MHFVRPLSLSIILLSGTFSARAAQVSAAWHSPELPFQALNLSATGPRLWLCGTNEAIAMSADNGAHWQVKHLTANGGVLLNIDFASSQFGYAAGTGGLLLTTEDGGETWVPRAGLNETILQISFSDPQHGLIRTPSSLLFTLDGGSHWSEVSAGQNTEEIKHFPYTFALAALDGMHIAVMLKQGAPQYEPQAFLLTEDAGKSWKFLNLPNVTLYGFLRVAGRYWAVGTEVIHKDQAGGGYAVPVALYSSDGENWSHSNADLSACKLHLCTLCNAQGCLSSNGVITRVFSDETTYAAFPPNKELSPRWASTNSAICFAAGSLQCAALMESPKAPENATSPLKPVVVSAGPLGAAASREPRCIVCAFDSIIVDQTAKKGSHAHTIKLVLEIARNGTVTSVDAQGGPTAEIDSQVKQQVQTWIFEPYLKNGVPVNLKLNTTVQVTLINPR